MVDAADWPDDGVGRACGRAVDRPDTGSALEDGQRPLAAFFLDPNPPSPFVVGLSPLVCGVGAGPVKAAEDELEDDDDDDDDDADDKVLVEEVEFVR